MHSVYILEMKNKKLYVGYTNNIQKRFEKHRLGKGAKTTRAFGVKKVVYIENFESKSKAMKREYEIKQFSRAQKLMLIKGKHA